MTRIHDPDFRLRDYYTPPSLPAAPKIGLNLDGLDRPTLKLVDYIHPELATPPAAISRSGQPTDPGRAPHPIVATVAVNPSNLTECRIAIDEFVDLQVAVALPITAQGQREWAVVGNPGTDPDSRPGSWGDHGVAYREYDAEAFKCVTWGTELLVTVPFHRGYAQEAHVVITQETLSKQGIGPSGVNWDDLIADIKALPRRHDGGNPAGGSSAQARLSEAYSLAPPRVSLLRPSPG